MKPSELEAYQRRQTERDHKTAFEHACLKHPAKTGSGDWWVSYHDKRAELLADQITTAVGRVLLTERDLQSANTDTIAATIREELAAATDTLRKEVKQVEARLDKAGRAYSRAVDAEARIEEAITRAGRLTTKQLGQTAPARLLKSHLDALRNRAETLIHKRAAALDEDFDQSPSVRKALAP